MIDFVLDIADYSRNKKGLKDFAVFCNGGEALGADQKYLNSVTGIAKEEVWYDFDKKPQPLFVTNSVTKNLDKFKNNNRLVLIIEYVDEKNAIDDVYKKAKTKGYIPYATIPSLNAITINAGHEPD